MSFLARRAEAFMHDAAEKFMLKALAGMLTVHLCIDADSRCPSEIPEA